MGLDVYISKTIFIGAMYNKSCGITGEIHLFKHGREVPVVLENVSSIIEQVYHGCKTWWLLEWLNRELPGAYRRLQGTPDQPVGRLRSLKSNGKML